MEKFTARVFLVSLLIILSGGLLTACYSSERKEGGKQQLAAVEPVTLNIMLWGDKPKQFDEVVAEFERQTMDTLHLRLNITFTPQADYVNKLKLKLAAGEQVDIVFDAPWMNMNTFIAEGSYANLDQYFGNDKYPGLKQAFSSMYMDNNKITGPDNQIHSYGLPLSRYLGELSTLYYRKDLAAAYGLPSIETYADLLAFFDCVLANDKTLTPLVMKNDGSYGANDLIWGNQDSPSRLGAGIWDLNLGPSVSASVFLKDHQIEGIGLSGEKDEALANFPEPYNHYDDSWLVTVREWHDKGYIEEEPIVRKYARDWFTSGKAAAMIEGVSNFEAINVQLKASVPDAELGIFFVQRQMRDKLQPNDLLPVNSRAWNYLCLPEASANKESSILFLDWLFACQDHHDLFELGIPGKHWNPVGKDKYTLPENTDISQNYTFPGYLMTWNPNYIRLSASVPDDLIEYYLYQADEKSYYESPFANFVFNQAPVQAELANPKFSRIRAEDLAYELAMVDHPASSYAELRKSREVDEALQQDIRKIKAELRKQLQNYLESN
ncbi:extracellular solute-binding protein [Paenibacillus odorifer]|uniref:extracellular solute-binding protein n=1 Tax=Paenibacillus odorifer TaxID=189426 RepID=UPI00096F75BE|nr:extracellular solute-binding protein [Paenibacillus odorifer]OME10762.1 hypothetical protein BSK60_23980 [Paenibacillus odorifer]